MVQIQFIVLKIGRIDAPHRFDEHKSNLKKIDTQFYQLCCVQLLI